MLIEIQIVRHRDMFLVGQDIGSGLRGTNRALVVWGILRLLPICKWLGLIQDCLGSLRIRIWAKGLQSLPLLPHTSFGIHDQVNEGLLAFQGLEPQMKHSVHL